MQNTLLRGDIVIVNKLKYGTCLPSVIKIPFLPNKIAGIPTYIPWELPLLRTPAWKKYKNGSICVFMNTTMESEKDLPIGLRTWFVKECFFGRTTVNCKGGIVHIDGKANPNQMVCYKVTLSFLARRNFFKAFIEDDWQAFIQGQGSSSSKEWYVIMTPKNAEKLRKKHNVISVEEHMADIIQSAGEVEEADMFKIPDDLADTIVPYKNFTVHFEGMEESSKILYMNTIKEHEGHKSVDIRYEEIDKKKVSVLYINNKKQSSYTFKEDYAAAIGRNTLKSSDLFYWKQFTPVKYIIGTADRLVCSLKGIKNKESWFLPRFFTLQFRWNRWGKKVI